MTRLTFFLYYIFVSVFLFAENPSQVNISRIVSRKGLSHNTVRAVAVDGNGFIWAGTLDGLNRYDGYNIRSYQNQLDNANNISDHRISKLFTDSKGVLWVKTYRNEISYYDSLNDTFHFIKDADGKLLCFENITEVTNGDIWLWKGGKEILRLSYQVDKTYHVHPFSYKENEVDEVNFFLEDSKQNYWFGTNCGLFQITNNDQLIKHGVNQAFIHALEINDQIYFSSNDSNIYFYHPISKKIETFYTPFNSLITDIIYLSDNQLLLLTQKDGIWEFNSQKYQFSKSMLIQDIDDFSNTKTIYDNKGGVWFFNQLGKLWYNDVKQKSLKKISLISSKVAERINFDKQSFNIDDILIDSEGLCWIVTYGFGVYCYDLEHDILTEYMEKSDKTAPASNYFLSITEDHYGNIWIGSEYTGLIKLIKGQDYIKIVRPENNDIDIGRVNNIRSILEDSRGNIWIGLKNGGLYIYDSTFSNGKLLKNVFNPYSIIEDDKQRVWIASNGDGVYLYDLETLKEIDHFKYQSDKPSSLCNNNVFHLLKDNKNRIWIATFGKGLSLVEEKKDSILFRNFLTDKGNKSLIRYLYQDKKGFVWAGSTDGLIRFNPDELINNSEAYQVFNMSIESRNSLSSHDIKTIYQDREGDIWVGTAGGGLNKFVEATSTEAAHFLSYNVKNGFPDNFILGILEYNNELWLSHESGLSCFNKYDYSIKTYQLAQMSYGNMFNEGANLMLKNGLMAWGSLDGLLLFDPAKFNPDLKTPPVLLTGLLVDGTDWNEIKTADEKSITHTESIKLNYNQNILNFEFATLSLRNPDRNQYSYKLENYDKNWSTPSYLNTANYKNLSPGHYIFKVKGSNSFGIWNNDVTTLDIIIKPPFWKSSSAFVFYILLLMILVYISFRLILKFNKLNNAIEVEKQLTNHKLRFFTNISHEFRTPLTLIQGAVENLNDIGELPSHINKQLRVLNRNLNNLRRLIDQLLEFRKLQNDVLKLDLEKTDLVLFTKDIYNSFQELSEQKVIKYNFITSVDKLEMYIDRKKVDKIIFNLLSNAFKFTSKGGQIELILTEDCLNRTCSISVKDTGIGIPKNKQHLLFSRFVQINFSDTGTGIGLSLVKEFIDVHKGQIFFEENPEVTGSIFKIILSTNKDIYQGENFIDSSYDKQYTARNERSIEKEEGIEIINQKVLADYNLLIIDDNDDILNFLVDGFKKYLHVEVACDGKEGLEKALNSNPDIIICDVMMPQMDGFEVTRQLKLDFQTCHIPIILLTAHSSNEHRFEGIESGADDYITKPFSLKYLQKRVLKMIEQRELLKKRFSNGLVIEGNLINTTDRNKEFYELIDRILEENYTKSDFTIDTFIELSKIKRTIFYKKVKGVTGFSPNDLIKIKRMNKSALLLKEGEMTISEVAYAVGFEDPFYFSKCFKAYFNCTPSNYKSGNDVSCKVS